MNGLVDSESNLGLLWGSETLDFGPVVSHVYGYLDKSDRAAAACVNRISPGCVVNCLNDRVHELPVQTVHQWMERQVKMEGFKCPGDVVALFEREKENPTWKGTQKLIEFSKDHSSLVVWKAMADTIEATDGPDLMNFQSLEGCQSMSAQFPAWCEAHREELSKVDRLDLDKKNIRFLPEELTCLTKLRILDCNQNSLERVIHMIKKLSLQGFNCTRNPLVEINKDIRQHVSIYSGPSKHTKWGI